MPITVNQLLEYHDLRLLKIIQWGQAVNTEREGIYIVSLSDDPNANNGISNNAPISSNIINKWILKVDGFKVDNLLTYDSNQVIERLSKFWLPDENILYIGKAPKRSNGKALGNRIGEYYRTEYGEKRPHAGGHWIKSLRILNDLFVYAIPCAKPGEVEINLLEYFVSNVINIPNNGFFDDGLCLPFANLQLTPRKKKKHGLGKMKKK